MPQNDFSALSEQLRQAACIESIDHLLDWDQQVNLSEPATEGRGEQRAYISAAHHAILGSSALRETLERLKARGDLSPLQQQIVDEADWRIARISKVPAELTRELALLKVRSVQAWERARVEQSFAGVESLLGSLIEASRARAAAIDSSANTYQTMLDDYERGITFAELETIFSELRPELTALLGELEELGAGKSELQFSDGAFPRAVQYELCREVVQQLGFSFDCGRLDTATHPSCSTCGPKDVRLTTRYEEDDFVFALTSAIHEAGHGLYDQGLDEGYLGTAKGRPSSLGVHESQSIIWERQVGLSEPFWKFCFPRARKKFPALEGCSQSEFYRWVHKVEPSLIRIAADEISYHLHIIARFELEAALMDGSLAPRDLPGAWDDKYRSLLGVSAAKPSEGVLQDVHWYAGYFGYFPTYTLGAVYAAQLFSAFEKTSPKWKDDFEAGDFGGLHRWLGKNIYSHGACYLPRELISNAAGEAPAAKYLMRYLREKYLGIFKQPA